MKESCIQANHCLQCRARLDRASGKGEPRPGDLTVCISCGHLMVFTEDLSFREPNPQERRISKKNPDIAQFIATVRAVARRRAAILN